MWKMRVPLLVDRMGVDFNTGIVNLSDPYVNLFSFSCFLWVCVRETAGFQGLFYN